MTVKCFQCIKDEYHNKIKWSEVSEAICIINGNSYCYEHLKKEVGWNDVKQKETDEVKT